MPRVCQGISELTKGKLLVLQGTRALTSSFRLVLKLSRLDCQVYMRNGNITMFQPVLKKLES